MHPVCFRIGNWPIHWYGVMMAIAFLAGIINWTLLGKKEGKDSTYCTDLAFWVMVAGIIGSRIAYVAANWEEQFAENPLEIFMIWHGGLIFYGGVIGAILTIILLSWLKQKNTLSLFDFVITSIPLGHFFGRLGCFLNGCCYGKPYDGLLSVRYPYYSAVYKDFYGKAAWNEHYAIWQSWKGTPQYDSYAAEHFFSVHPIQLYESLANLAMYIMLLWAFKHRKGNGSVFALYLIMYPVFRFAAEYFRGDPRKVLGPLTLAQCLSLLLMAIGFAIWSWSRSQHNNDEYKNIS